MRLVLLAAAIAVLPFSVQAQTVDRAVTAQSVPLGRAQPFAVVSWRPAWGDSEVLALYVAWDRMADDGGTGSLVVRREVWPARDQESTDPLSLAWADSRTCPGLEAAVVAMENIQMPALNVPAFGRGNPNFITADGVLYELTTRSSVWGDHAGSTTTLSSNVGTSLADCVEGVRSAAAGCWDSAPPPAI